MANSESNIIIYNTIDGKASVVIYAHDGSVYISNGGYYVLSGELTDGSVVVSKMVAKRP